MKYDGSGIVSIYCLAEKNYCNYNLGCFCRAVGLQKRMIVDDWRRNSEGIHVQCILAEKDDSCMLKSHVQRRRENELRHSNFRKGFHVLNTTLDSLKFYYETVAFFITLRAL